ncbi:MAG TPA: thioredoxin family protein [Clostridia bacterium]|nr:thioredoxin family protein [Clostridia bacterium]
MIVKVLGGGCKNCEKLYANVQEAAKNKGVEIAIEKVTDYKDIVSYGVMKTPALVVDEEVKVSGRVAKASEIEKFLV